MEQTRDGEAIAHDDAEDATSTAAAAAATIHTPSPTTTPADTATVPPPVAKEQESAHASNPPGADLSTPSCQANGFDLELAQADGEQALASVCSGMADREALEEREKADGGDTGDVNAAADDDNDVNTSLAPLQYDSSGSVVSTTSTPGDRALLRRLAVRMVWIRP